VDPTAILIAPHGVTGTLPDLVDRLEGVDVTVNVVDDLPSAVELYAASTSRPCVMLDLRGVAGGEIEDLRATTEAVRAVLGVLPHSLPVAVLEAAHPATLIACLRAGAGDVVDLELEGTATAHAVVQRICEKQSERAVELETLESRRAMIEDLFKDLIKTERRSIDAEEKLAAHARHTANRTAIEDVRPPAILLVEHDRDVADQLAELLEAAGIATFAYATGEEALREAETLATTAGLDLALVAVQLPGMDGLETVRRLRKRVTDLPAFLITSAHETDVAVDAVAELGIVGFVQKPFSNIEDVVVRLSRLARDALSRTREGLYLQRIKERHERVLARYRSLPREG
jgi:CheY-like chemotaxis protein